MFSLVKESFNLFKKNAGECIGFLLLMGILYFLNILSLNINIFIYFLIFGFIPPIAFGLTLYIHRYINSGQARFSNIFEGLRHRFLSINILMFFSMIVFNSFLKLATDIYLDEHFINFLTNIKFDPNMKFTNDQINMIIKFLEIAIVVFVPVYIILGFAPHFLYFKDQGLFSALNNSIQFGVKNIYGILQLNLTILLLNFIGFSFCLSGLFITIPMSIIMTYLYFRNKELLPILTKDSI